MQHIVICADGTWNRPEKEPDDVATNVLRLARAVRPFAAAGQPQHVFYDWGIGSYYERVRGGVTGLGIHKNIMDAYRYIVQNYAPGSRIYLFGFSRGAYTVRSLCGLINNCGILKRPDARLIQAAFEHYKHKGKAYKPSGKASVAFRRDHSHASREVYFVGAWDTVGALGLPISVLGLFDSDDEFYDTKLGDNVRTARHAMAIDERREDFEPTLWLPRKGLDLKQVWFAGSHADVGGGYPADDAGLLASDVPLKWMLDEARRAGLEIEMHLPRALRASPAARLHNSRRLIYRAKRPLERPLAIPQIPTEVHSSVLARRRHDPGYRPANLERRISAADSSA
ncbi:MAG: DUF2235 domain-containing protein [Chromatocurvus sp.]